jgi:hypothetical protein
MIERRCCPRLSLKALQQTLVASQGRRKELQGDVAAQIGVFSFIDDSHPTFAELRLDVIVRDGPAKHTNASGRKTDRKG